MKAPSDGDICLSNGSQDDFGFLQFGGTTASYPALKRDGTDLHVRLADDSAFTKLFVQTLEKSIKA